MALKLDLTEEERHGLTQDEYLLARRWLRQHKTAGVLHDGDALMIFELYMIGTSFKDMHLAYPRWPLGQIILTIALRKWSIDRERMMGSLRERVKAKVVKSVIESVDLLTSMISVAGTENLDEMRKYIQDPTKNPKPELRIKNIKEYKEILETLHKLVEGATVPKAKGSGTSTMYGALEDTSTYVANKTKKIKGRTEEDDTHVLLAEMVGDEDE